jgi:hypothetical protein
MCPAPCEGGALKALSVRSATAPTPGTLSCLALAAFAAEKAPRSKTGLKMPHPEQPEAKLIDSIVEPERYAFADADPFVDRWTYWFSDLFENNGGELGGPGRNIFYDYIRANVRIHGRKAYW